ncbi:alcohol dehydrogenase-like protein [Diplodia corticola]|uniref:Alcohol dehydrogenase-like protein n=1 Tax=Diplodia corticola TaxID=236234 RepID=A0A1J9RGS8_9PEZI|nr:alcohol dehydrogenase-like protein [Diplodia corticola]OJD40750.1 alcohol dehydrogenase-like protein [Diplodia corticola]
MKEAIVHPGVKVEIVDSPIPTPNDDQVLIKVVVSGSNPKDWKLPDWTKTARNEGDDIAGVVEKVGANVTEFKRGDRVAAFHEMMQPHGSYAEYAIAWAHTTFHIPKDTTFEEAAAIPLAAMTAAVGLYLRLELPEPWRQPADPPTRPTPLVIYGAASAVGSYAMQLASRSNIHPLICVAGRGAAHVERLLDRSKGDAVVDYRQGGPGVVAGIKAALPAAAPLLHAFDAVSDHGSYEQLGECLAPGGKITLVLPGKQYDGLAQHVVKTVTNVGAVHGDAKEFGFVWFRLFGRGLKEGWLTPQPQEVVPGGLGGVQTALENLRDGKASAVKYVFRIADTEGAAKL